MPECASWQRCQAPRERTFLRDDPGPFQVHLVGRQDGGVPPAGEVADAPQVAQDLLRHLEGGSVHHRVGHHDGVGLVRGQSVLDLKRERKIRADSSSFYSTAEHR